MIYFQIRWSHHDFDEQELLHKERRICTKHGKQDVPVGGKGCLEGVVQGSERTLLQGFGGRFVFASETLNMYQMQFF